VRIAVLTIGSRGDVEPFLVLASALRGAGHDVRVGAAPNFAPLAAQHGLPFHALGLDTRALMQDAQTRNIIGSGHIFGALRGGPLQRLRDRQTRITRDAWQIAQQVDAVVYKSGLAAGSTVAEARGIPAVAVALQPMAPTAAFAPPLSGITFDAGALGNRALGRVLAAAIWSIGRAGVHDLRRELGLRPLPYLGVRPADEPTTLHVYSPLVVPRPPDWPPHFHVTGYLVTPDASSWEPPDALRQFLAAGRPPVYIGFGSMTHADPKRLLAQHLEALRRTGQRAVLLGGWTELGQGAHVPDSVHTIAEAPHDWLFPRMAAVVHHGGAGTTAAALRAGVPSLVISHNFDQPFWGRRVLALGAGPAPIRLRDLTEDRLTDAIDHLVHDAAMRQRAADLGHRLRAEDGVAETLDRIHAVIDPDRRPLLEATRRRSRY
jgi:sterol 3beta-glucosyltransferase